MTSQPPLSGYRLSPPQQRLWAQHGAIVGPHRVCAAVSMEGPGEPAGLERAWRACAASHEGLRTTYQCLPGMTDPVQMVEEDLPWSFECEDLGDLDPGEQAAAVDARYRALAEMPIDLARGPVWAARVLGHAPERATLLLMWPSLVADLASAGILVRQIARRLDAGAASAASGLQHVDVSEWQHELLAAEGTAAGRDFWRQLDRDAALACRLPLRQAEARRGPFAPRTLQAPLPDEGLAGAARWAAEHGRTLADVLLACWQLLAWRLTGRADVCLGVDSAGRSLADLGSVVGPLAKTLPLRLLIDRRWSFARLVERSQAALQDHRRWHDVFAWNLLDGRAAAPGAPVCPLGFAVVAEEPIATSSGVRFSLERADACLDGFELKLTIVLADGRSQARWAFDDRVHTAEQIACVADEYASVVSQIGAGRPPALECVDVRGAHDRAATRRLGAAPAPDPARDDRCVHGLFDAQARATPARVAATCGERRVTYRELERRAEDLARVLRARGIGPEARVAVLLDRSIDLLAAVLGILKAGGAFVPLVPSQPIARLVRLADRTRAALVLTHRRYADDWPVDCATRPLALDRWPSPAEDARATAVPVPVRPDNLCYVMFTSGSTGDPNGVMISHRAFVSYVRWCQEAYIGDAPVDVPLHSSVGFDATLTSLLVPLCTGGCVIAIPQERPIDAIRSVADAATSFGLLKMTPAHLGLIASETVPDRLPGLAGLLVVGGEALDAAQLAPWRQHAPATRVVNEYGPTEATVGCVAYEAPAASLSVGPVPIGCPLPGVTCCIVDDCGQPAATGVAGELYVGGVQVSRGYDGRPDLTAARFVPAPFGGEPGARWYRTGDRVRLRADGLLEYAGRRDDQVKLHGHRIEPGEVEAVCRRQGGVREAAVVLREDPGGARQLVAYVVPAGGTPLAIDRLRDALRAELPDYMLPARLVLLDALPLTPHGKVDRSHLPAPPDERPALTSAYVPPRSGAEAILAGIWADVLRVDRVGRADNFFVLGGDSILSLQMVARAARAGLRLAPRQVFDHQTVEALAAVAEQAPVAERTEGPVSGPVPLTPIQHRFFERALQAAHHHNHAVTLEVAEPIEATQFNDIWLAVQRHHDVLRMRYRRVATGWTQFNEGADRAVPPTWIDGSTIDPRRRPAAWRRVAAASHAALDLVTGPLARAAIVRWDAAAPMHLLVVIHHLLVDGASWRFLLDDLRELCGRAPSQPDPARWTLPPKTLSFKAWAERLAARAAAGGFDSQLPLWLEMSAPGMEVPRDHASGRNDVASERAHRCSLSARETADLVHRLPGIGVHVPDVLISSVIHALSRWAGAGAWRLDVERHGREPIEAGDDLSRTVGWFTAIHPLRVETTRADTPVAVLRAVRSALRRLPNAGIGYGALRYLAGHDAASRLRQVPGAEVVFNYWGQVDHGLAAAAAVRPTSVPTGATRAAGHAREHVLDVSASTTDGRLHLWWTYSGNLHRADTIERLARMGLEALRELLAMPAADRGSLATPADFPLADLSQPELDDLVSRGGAVSDVYPLSPLQEALLFQHLYDSDGALYVQQCRARLRGPLDREAFRLAWEAAVARHDALRTGFTWERSGAPLAVVYEAATLPWHEEDWRSLPAPVREERLSELRSADRRRAFAPGRPPLTRLALLRLGEAEWEVLWTTHHLVLDGWSGQVVLSDVFNSYFAARAGRQTTAPPPARYAPYIAWLREQDPGRAQAFWTETLAGLRSPCLLASPPVASRESAAARSVARSTLPPALVQAMQALAQARRITLNTWFAGTWAVLLAYCTKRDEVVFGTVVSGRPPHLPDIETMTGLFANTLPLRLRPASTTAAVSFFADCQRAQVDAREYEHVSLARIRGWIDFPPGMPLFDTIFAYENYPAAAAWRQPSDVHVVDLDTAVPTEYPLGVDIGRVDDDLVVTLSFDQPRVGAALAAFLLDGFQAVFARLAASPDCTVGSLFDALDDCAMGRLSTIEGRRHSHRQALRKIHESAGAEPAALPRHAGTAQ